MLGVIERETECVAMAESGKSSSDRPARAAADAPVSIRIPVAWGEMDAFGHVNNAVYFRYLETARIEFLRRIGWSVHAGHTGHAGNATENAIGGAGTRAGSEGHDDAHGVGVILHSVQARFRAPVVFPDTLIVTSRLLAIETDRFTLGHEIWSEKLGIVVTEGSGTIVSYRYAKKEGERGEKTPIPRRYREAMLALSLPPTSVTTNQPR